MASPTVERWTEFWTDADHLAVRAVVRPGVLALRAIGPYKEILSDLEIPLRLEGPFKQGTSLVTLPLLDSVLRHMPQTLQTWITTERPDWTTWMAREQRLHAARAQVAVTLAEWSGRADPPPQSDLFAAAANPVATAAPDHPCHDLYGFQQTGVQWLALAQGRAILGDDMGLGKTPQILSYCDLEPAVRRLLVVCPSVVTINWRREAVRWAPSIPLHVGKSTAAVRKILAQIDKDQSEGLAWCVECAWTGRAPDRAGESCPRCWGPTQQHRWGLVISWGLLRQILPELIAAGFDTVVADEAHNAKTPEAQRTRALHELGWLAERRIGASGTEIQNRPAEAWPLFSFVDPLAFPAFKPFGELFCGPRTETYRGREVRTYKGASRLPRLNALARTYIQRRTKRAVLPQLPPKRRQFLPIEAPAAFAKQYKTEIKALRSGTDDQAMGRVAKMRQQVGLAKVPAAVDWILGAHDNDQAVVVFVHHQQVHANLRDVLNEIGLRVDSIVGATTQTQRQDRVDAFQAGELDVLIGSTAMKEGVTLTHAAHTLHVERWWVPGDEEQAEDRVCRIGQTRGVLNVYLHLNGSLDDYVHALIEAKRLVVATVQDRTPIDRAVLKALLA